MMSYFSYDENKTQKLTIQFEFHCLFPALLLLKPDPLLSFTPLSWELFICLIMFFSSAFHLLFFFAKNILSPLFIFFLYWYSSYFFNAYSIFFSKICFISSLYSDNFDSE
jgi:hypothetical protein